MAYVAASSDRATRHKWLRRQGSAAGRLGFQAEHLVFTDTAFGMAALAVAQQARRRPASGALSDQALCAEPGK